LQEGKRKKEKEREGEAEMIYGNHPVTLYEKERAVSEDPSAVTALQRLYKNEGLIIR